MLRGTGRLGWGVEPSPSASRRAANLDRHPRREAWTGCVRVCTVADAGRVSLLTFDMHLVPSKAKVAQKTQIRMPRNTDGPAEAG